SDNPQFISGETDLRGVFTAEGLRGMVTAVARKGDAQYAFYRGTTYLGPPPAVPTEGKAGAPHQAEGQPNQPANSQSLDANFQQQNTDNFTRQIRRLEQRFNPPSENLKGAPAGSFH